jgi:2,4-dienoyl-CoA reductase-like NADH-dependent reductase (Old Yellow Enzyme family)
LRNRFVMPGMQRGFMNDGAPTPQMVAYMRRCAAGGAAFVISYRFSQFKEVDYGATIASGPEDLRAMLSLLRKADVDLFNISSRRFRKREWPDSDHPDLTIAAVDEVADRRPRDDLR